MGYADVDGMLASIPAPLFLEWLAYYELEPWGETRADLRAGIVAATMANVYRSHDSQPLEPKDFMPRFEPEEPVVDWREMLAVVENLNRAYGGSDLRPARQLDGT